MIPMSMQYFLCRALQRYADRVALVAGEQGITYAELDRRSTRLAAAFAAAGLAPGDRCAILLRNRPAFYETELAIAKAGLVKVPINVRLTIGEILTILRDCDAAGVVFEPEFGDGILGQRSQLQDMRLLVCAGEARDPAVAYDALLDSAASDFAPVPVAPDDIYSIRYSGGTTGKPKGIVHSHASCVAISLSVIREYDVGHEERSLQVTHPAHGANFVWPALLGRGATLYLMEKFDPEGALAMIPRHRITRVSMVPTMWYAVLDCPRIRDYDLSSLRTAAYVSAPMASERVKQALDVLGPRFMSIYTLTESAVISTVIGKHEFAVDEPTLSKRAASCGREADDVQLRIVDETGRDVPDGEVGEIILKSPGNMIGYWKQPEQTRQVLRDGWVWTGDVGRRDEDGYVYLIDRKHDKIVTGGFNVYPREVEEVLFQHPGVREAAVVALPDERWGEVVTAFVCLAAPNACSVDEILSFCRERMAHFKVPKLVRIVDELPRTSVGKIARRILADSYWTGRERRIG